MSSVSGIINCTPHPINIYSEDKTEVIKIFPKSDYIARCNQEEQKNLGVITTESGREIPVVSRQLFKDVVGLPPVEGNNYPDIIVSIFVGNKLRETGEWLGAVFGSDMGDGAVREDKKILGTTRLIKYCSRQSDSQDENKGFLSSIFSCSKSLADSN